MRKIIRSLQTQFLVLILGITLALILVLGFLNLQTVNGTSTRIAAMSLNWQAQRTSAPIQGVLHQHHGHDGHPGQWTDQRCTGPQPAE